MMKSYSSGVLLLTVALGAYSEQATAGEATCPEGMIGIENYCIDQFEAPNDPAQFPLVMYTFDEAEAWCSARGKRLCYDDEWTRACGGPPESNYPYGDTHDPGQCIDDKTWLPYNQSLLNQWPGGVSSPAIDSLIELLEAASLVSMEGEESAVHVDSLYQAELPGTKTCTTIEMVSDTVGNVEEWTRRRDGGSPGFNGNLKGRYWAESRTCHDDITSHGDAFRFYELGFRCCADPGAEPPSCPDLLPVADSSGKTPGLIISAIDPGESIELFNSTAAPIDLGASDNSLCSPFNYSPLPTLSPGTVIGPGAYATLPWPAAFFDTESGGQIILYESLGAFTPENMVDFVCWGTGTGGRKAEAEGAGHWTGDCLSAISAGQTLRRLPANDGADLTAYDVSAEPESCEPVELAFLHGFEPNQPPTAPTSVVIDPPTPTSAMMLTCIASGAMDPDSETVFYNYQWIVDNVLVGGNTVELDSSLTARGQPVRCEAQADDGAGGQSGFVASADVVILNAPPTLPEVDLQPDSPFSSLPLTCQISAISMDADSDPISYSYRWFKDEVLTENTTNVTDSGQTAPGQVFRCEIAAFDGFDASGWASSPSREILADP